MATPSPPVVRATSFCERFGLRAPILLAPMAGACPPALSVAVGEAGGMGACGALLLSPDEIRAWAADVRSGTDAPFQINVWIPDPPPARDAARESAARTFLNGWGPTPPDPLEVWERDFDGQCAAILDAGPAVVSSIMGLYPPEFVDELHRRGIPWFATVTTVAEARKAAEAGADVIVAQGAESGGHRGAFEADGAESRAVGLFALLPAVVDAVDVPVVATGGIGDARGVAAALLLGASAAQVGTGFLRTPEAGLPPAWADALASAAPEDTAVTRVYSGRAGRTIRNAYVQAAAGPDAPPPLPFPVQAALTAPLRQLAREEGDIDRMQAWAGQSAAMAPAVPAGELVHRLWEGARALLGG